MSYVVMDLAWIKMKKTMHEVKQDLILQYV
jgi:hypothetical protein